MIKFLFWIIIFGLLAVYNQQVIFLLSIHKITTSLFAIACIFFVLAYLLKFLCFILRLPKLIWHKVNNFSQTNHINNLLQSYLYCITSNISKISKFKLGTDSIHDIILRYKIESNIDKKRTLLNKIRENKEFQQFADQELENLLLDNDIYDEVLEIAILRRNKELMLKVYIARKDWNSVDRMTGEISCNSICNYCIELAIKTQNVDDKITFLQKALYYIDQEIGVDKDFRGELMYEG